CSVCDLSPVQQTTNPGQNWNDHDSKNDYDAFYHTLVNLIDVPIVKTSRKLRILAVQTIRRFVNHMTDERYLDLATDVLGRWCMRCFQSSFRELRMASA